MINTGKTIQGVPVYTDPDIPAGLVYIVNSDDASLPTAIQGNTTAEQDIAATRRWVGPDADIVGGGPENGHFTGVR